MLRKSSVRISCFALFVFALLEGSTFVAARVAPPTAESSPLISPENSTVGTKATQPPVASDSPTPTISENLALPADFNVFVKLSKKMVPSVVNISTLTTVKSPFPQGGPDDLWRKFFGDLFQQYNRGRLGDGEDDEEGGQPFPPSGPGPGGGRSSKLPKAMSLGSGFIIDSSGLILTNNHVVQDADEIKIFFTESSDEKPTDGEVVGRDPEIDVALIKVKKKDLTPVVLGDSDKLEVGEYVAAVGNPFGQGHSVTHGIISAKGRAAPGFPLANYIQTDTPINPGNSGGPLVNLKGEVIAINNAIDARAQGIGFAIPINLVKNVLPQLRTKGAVARGYIGVLVVPLTPDVATKIGVKKDTQNPVVSHVYPGDPADKAGLKAYDVILEFNGRKIKAGEDLIAAVTSTSVGDDVPVKIYRGGEEKILTIKVAQRQGAGTSVEKKESNKKNHKKRAPVDTGMTLETLTPEVLKKWGIPDKVEGVIVANTTFGGPADKAEIAQGDIILEVDRTPIKNVDDFYAIVKEKKSYLLRVRRADSQGNEGFTVVVLNLK